MEIYDIDFSKCNSIKVNGLAVEFIEDAKASCDKCLFYGFSNEGECKFVCDNGYFRFVELPKVDMDYVGVSCPECGEVIEVSNPGFSEPWQCPECETYFEVNPNGVSD
jgi:hypothetical protein